MTYQDGDRTPGLAGISRSLPKLVLFPGGRVATRAAPVVIPRSSLLGDMQNLDHMVTATGQRFHQTDSQLGSDLTRK